VSRRAWGRRGSSVGCRFLVMARFGSVGREGSHKGTETRSTRGAIDVRLSGGRSSEARTDGNLHGTGPARSSSRPRIGHLAWAVEEATGFCRWLILAGPAHGLEGRRGCGARWQSASEQKSTQSGQHVQPFDGGRPVRLRFLVAVCPKWETPPKLGTGVKKDQKRTKA